MIPSKRRSKEYHRFSSLHKREGEQPRSQPSYDKMSPSIDTNCTDTEGDTPGRYNVAATDKHINDHHLNFPSFPPRSVLTSYSSVRGRKKSSVTPAWILRNQTLDSADSFLQPKRISTKNVARQYEESGKSASAAQHPAVIRTGITHSPSLSHNVSPIKAVYEASKHSLKSWNRVEHCEDSLVSRNHPSLPEQLRSIRKAETPNTCDTYASDNVLNYHASENGKRSKEVKINSHLSYESSKEIPDTRRDMEKPHRYDGDMVPVWDVGEAPHESRGVFHRDKALDQNRRSLNGSPGESLSEDILFQRLHAPASCNSIYSEDKVMRVKSGDSIVDRSELPCSKRTSVGTPERASICEPRNGVFWEKWFQLRGWTTHIESEEVEEGAQDVESEEDRVAVGELDEQGTLVDLDRDIKSTEDISGTSESETPLRQSVKTPERRLAKRELQQRDFTDEDQITFSGHLNGSVHDVRIAGRPAKIAAAMQSYLSLLQSPTTETEKVYISPSSKSYTIGIRDESETDCDSLVKRAITTKLSRKIRCKSKSRSKQRGTVPKQGDSLRNVQTKGVRLSACNHEGKTNSLEASSPGLPVSGRVKEDDTLNDQVSCSSTPSQEPHNKGNVCVEWSSGALTEKKDKSLPSSRDNDESQMSDGTTQMTTCSLRSTSEMEDKTSPRGDAESSGEDPLCPHFGIGVDADDANENVGKHSLVKTLLCEIPERRVVEVSCNDEKGSYEEGTREKTKTFHVEGPHLLSCLSFAGEMLGSDELNSRIPRFYIKEYLIECCTQLKELKVNPLLVDTFSKSLKHAELVQCPLLDTTGMCDILYKYTQNISLIYSFAFIWSFLSISVGLLTSSLWRNEKLMFAQFANIVLCVVYYLISLSFFYGWLKSTRDIYKKSWISFANQQIVIKCLSHTMFKRMRNLQLRNLEESSNICFDHYQKSRRGLVFQLCIFTLHTLTLASGFLSMKAFGFFEDNDVRYHFFWLNTFLSWLVSCYTLIHTMNACSIKPFSPITELYTINGILGHMEIIEFKKSTKDYQFLMKPTHKMLKNGFFLSCDTLSDQVSRGVDETSSRDAVRMIRLMCNARYPLWGFFCGGVVVYLCGMKKNILIPGLLFLNIKTGASYAKQRHRRGNRVSPRSLSGVIHILPDSRETSEMFFKKRKLKMNPISQAFLLQRNSSTMTSVILKGCVPNNFNFFKWSSRSFETCILLKMSNENAQLLHLITNWIS